MKNKKIHLLITTANLPENICNQIYGSGYNYKQRIDDYKKSFELVDVFRDNFDTITILETVSKEKVDYLHDYGFITYYSGVNNFFSNKGLNEIDHVYNYLMDNNYNIDDNDIIVKLSGRYFIENMNILSYINKNYELIVKDDNDIYKSGLGVHSFYYAISKKLFFDFYIFVNLDFDNKGYKKDVCIEWELKNFAKTLSDDICCIIPPLDKIGVITNTYYKDINNRIIERV